MASTIWKYQNYNAPIQYLFDKQIVEMDISKANISILMSAGKISRETYNELYEAPRHTRQYLVGCMIRDNHSLQGVLNEGLENARHALFDTLGLENSNILHIAKDAVFIIVPMNQRVPDTIPIDHFIAFTKRASFTNYLRLNKLIHFYHSYNITIGLYEYKIRGMSENAQKLHHHFFTQVLIEILTGRQMNGFKVAYEITKQWYEKLSSIDNIALVDYLRRFDSQSLFDLKGFSEFAPFQADYLSESARLYVDPSYNLSLLNDIGNYLLCEAISGI